MKEWVGTFFLRSAWSGVLLLTGAVIALYATEWRLRHAQLQAQIEQLDDQWGVVCIARGERMECRFERLLDPGV